eukprot:5562138-Pyramimonas_sp.AAC.1
MPPPPLHAYAAHQSCEGSSLPYAWARRVVEDARSRESWADLLGSGCYRLGARCVWHWVVHPQVRGPIGIGLGLGHRFVSRGALNLRRKTRSGCEIDRQLGTLLRTPG